MYFTGTLSVDPSQATRIEIIQPTKAFAKILHVMTAGLASKREEEETFTAISILQQLNMALRSMGIDNIVRLAKDDYDFYLDEEGKEGDLKDTVEGFRLHTDHYESELFETLYVVLEHEDAELKYLIEINIHRRHKVGEYPIEVKVNGILKDMQKLPEEGYDDVKEKMAPIFASQENYDAYMQKKRAAFDQFVAELEQSMRKFIKIDDVVKDSNTNLIRPKKPVQGMRDIPTHQHAEPIYYGYHGYGDAFLYAWFWSSMTHSHDIHVHNVDVVDSSGAAMMHVGDEGFNAGETDTLNPEAEFEPPASGDVDYLSEHEFQSEFDDAKLGADIGPVDAGSDSGGSWLDSFGDFGGGGDSSCSSCGSSCGGGCGGD